MGILEKLFGQKAISKENDAIKELKLELEGQMMALHESAIVSETDIRGNIIFANDMFCQISGYSREELMGKNHRILKSGLHPDSVYEEMWKTISSGNVWKGIVSNRAKNGSIYWVKAVVLPILDEKNIPIKYVSARIDITAQINLEQEMEVQMEELKSHEEELRQTMEELTVTNEQLEETQIKLKHQFSALNNAAIVSITDIRGNITYANKTFTEISGYSQEELLGKNHRILKSGHQPDSIFKEMWETITSGKVWQGLVKNRAKNGTYYWVHSTITPILDSKNVPVEYIAIRFDVTSEVEMGQTLDNSQATIEQLNSSLALAKNALEKKLDLVKRELTDSLMYAQRIQQALIPSPKYIHETFGENYHVDIFFKPQQPVSGDFYYCHKVRESMLFFFGDSAGHGVPGSMIAAMSIYTIQNLVEEKGIFMPDMLVREMDIALQNKLQAADTELMDAVEGNAVLFDQDKIYITSANRPALIVSETGEVTEVAFAKKAIGGKHFLGDNQYNLDLLKMNIGDTLYLFSDGFEDQLGGPNGNKKFSKASFYELLSKLHIVPSLQKRVQILYQKLEDWKGFFQEQTDDVTVVIIKKVN